MKNLLTILLIVALGSNVTGQQSTCWVTAENPTVINQLIADGVISSSKKALPASRNEKLQQVYEIKTNDLISFLRIVDKEQSISQPEIIEEYTPLYTPNDYSLAFPNDYALSLINAQEAWDITKGDPLISIGILDTGYDTIHEELTGKFNHLTPMSAGVNIVHGTAVAITAAGNTDNQAGKSSIGFNCELSLRNMSYNEMLAATYAGVRIINVSWASGCMYNSYYQSVIDEVYNNGTVIVAAAGNGPTCGGPDMLVYPAAFDHVISVTSIDENDHHQPVPNDPTSTHQHNDKIDLTAPGYNVPLSLNGNNYVTGNGTSFAAPFVSGTVGLMLSVNPCLTPDQIEMILKATAVDIYSNNMNFAGQLGAGRLDAHAAVQMAKDMHPIKVSVNQNNSTCSEYPGVFVTLDSGNVSNHTIQWSDGSNNWNRYNLPSGSYSYMITNTNGCMLFDTVSYYANGPAFDYMNSIEVTSNSQVIEDINGDGVIRIKGSVIIHEGVNYSIQDKVVEFTENTDLPVSSDYPTSGIVVKPNASLLVENTSFDVAGVCASYWGGIEVWSNGLNQPGRLEFINSTISHARIGISTIPKTLVGQSINEGGKVRVTSSLFENNHLSVHLEGQGRSTEINTIKNSLFTITEGIANTEFIKAKALQFTLINCQFEGNDSLPVKNRGIGVHLVDAQFSNTSIKPQFAQYNAKFMNLSKGIYVETNSSNKLNIQSMSFDQNLIGVELINAKNVQIRKCSIVLPNGSYANRSHGILQTGTSASSIYSNSFIGTGDLFSNGITLIEQLDKNNSIRNNEFTGEMNKAIELSGNNHLDEFSCNDFSLQGEADVIVTENNGHEGSLDIDSDLLLNSFSSCSDVNTNLNFESSATIFNYIDYGAYVPNCVIGNTQTQSLSSTVDRESKCKLVREVSIDYKESKNYETETTSVEEEFKGSYGLYPNPNNGSFTIQSTEDIEEVQIFNANGQLIKVLQNSQIGSSQSLDLTAGYYSVVYTKNNQPVKTFKMIVQ